MEIPWFPLVTDSGEYQYQHYSSSELNLCTFVPGHYTGYFTAEQRRFGDFTHPQSGFFLFLPINPDLKNSCHRIAIGGMYSYDQPVCLNGFIEPVNHPPLVISLNP